MMAKWEVTEDELRLTKEEAAVLKQAASSVDIGEVRWQLLHGVAEFTGCKGWATNRHLPENETMVFCGLRSDVEFATWLLEHLERFVRAEIAEFEMGILAWARSPRDIEPAVMVSMMMTSTLSFTNACCARISERLLALARQTAAAATGNTHALIVVKNAAIASAIAKAGITFETQQLPQLQEWDDGAEEAGREAGDRASFARPIEGRAALAMRLPSPESDG
jgi:hypothetical protein